MPNKVSGKTIYAVSKTFFNDNIWSIVNSPYYIMSNILCCKFMSGSGNKQTISSKCVVLTNLKVVYVWDVIEVLWRIN